MYFDTHTHLDDKQFDHDREQVIARICGAGVTLAVNIGADIESSRAGVRLSEQYDFIYAAVGVHPHEAETLTEEDMDALKSLAQSPKVVAIGEIGLDYYYDNARRDLQRKWFFRQLQLARELKLPYVVHNRDAHQDTMDIIRQSGYFRGVMHCYSGSVEMARELLDLGFFISFAGPVTFKNGKKAKEAAKFVPIDRLLIETDSPYLCPEPHRGERNDSSYVPLVAREIAALKGLSEEEVARATLANGRQFFQI